MAEFKVGDIVYHTAIDTGRTYKVIAVKPDGLVFEGFEELSPKYPGCYTLVKEEKPVLDFTKPITTRDGRKVRILCTDRKGFGDYCVLALVEEAGEETVRSYKMDGAFSSKAPSYEDLVNVPEKKYLNLYKTTTGASYFSTREDAEKDAKGRPTYVKTIEVEL